MLVYRLERNGIGPFMGRSVGRGTTSRKKNQKARHIGHQVKTHGDHWTKHMKAVNGGGYVFGTKSKDLLKAYFSFNLKPYFATGYRIKTYDVPDHVVLDMGHELAFPVRYHKLKTVTNVRNNIPK